MVKKSRKKTMVGVKKNVKKLKIDDDDSTEPEPESFSTVFTTTTSQDASVPSSSTFSNFKEDKDGDDDGTDNLITADNEDQGFQVDGNSRLFIAEHPMLNPMLVMKMVELYNPDLDDFKILRQVCKCWYDVTFDLWRKKFILRLTEEKEVFRETRGTGIAVGEFLKRFEDPDDTFQLASQPYSKYTFTELTLDMNICDKEGSECKRFWDNVGPLMEYLHFNRCFFPSGQYMAFEQLLFEKVPNLKTLAITDTGKVTLPSLSSDSPYSQRQKAFERIRMMKDKLLDDHPNITSLRIYGGIPIKLKKLISKLPNLEDLRVRNSNHTSATYDDCILDVLIFLRKQRLQSNHTKYNLKNLDLMHTKVFYSWFSITRVFDQVRFPLTSLSVEIKPDQSLNHQALKPLLEHHSHTLKTLKVFCPPLSNTNYHDTFPFDINLERLEEMQLNGNVVRSLKFLKFTPNLKRLLVNRYCVEKWEEVVMQQKEISHFGWFHHRTYILPYNDDMVQKTVTQCDMSLVEASKLETLRIDYDFNQDSLQSLKQWAPNLKTLWTILNKRTLPVVCELWPNLKHLRAMFQSDLDDEAITGWTFEKDQPKERLPGACLVDLKDLRKFQLDTLCSKSKLTDKAAIHGFFKMERLDAIHICVSAKMKAETEAKLKKQIPFVRIIRNYGRKPHSSHCAGDGDEKSNVGVCCFHKKFFETLRNDENAHRHRQNQLARARERRRGRQNAAAAAAMDLASSSSSDSSNSGSDDEEDNMPRLRFERRHHFLNM